MDKDVNLLGIYFSQNFLRELIDKDLRQRVY